MIHHNKNQFLYYHLKEFHLIQSMIEIVMDSYWEKLLSKFVKNCDSNKITHFNKIFDCLTYNYLEKHYKK